MSERDKAKLRRALSSRDREINDAVDRLYTAFSQSDATLVPSESQLAVAARSLRDNYRAVSAAVAKIGTRVAGGGQLADGLAECGAAYDNLARGLQTSGPASGNSAFDQMEALLQSAEEKVSSALGRLSL